MYFHTCRLVYPRIYLRRLVTLLLERLAFLLREPPRRALLQPQDISIYERRFLLVALAFVLRLAFVLPLALALVRRRPPGIAPGFGIVYI